MEERKLTDPWADVDRAEDPSPLIEGMEARSRGEFFSGLLEVVCDDLPETSLSSILDVGCGSGVHTRWLSAYLGEKCNITGADPSCASISVAKELSYRDGLSGPIDFCIADGRNLPFPNETFDLCYCVTVLVHAQGPGEILSEMVRVTRPGGTVLAIEPDYGTTVLAHTDKALVRKVLNAMCDCWGDGWIGRKLPHMLRTCALKDVRVVPGVRMSTQYDKEVRERIRGMAELAVLCGHMDRNEMSSMLDDLAGCAQEDRFFFSENFYCVYGRKVQQSSRQ